MSAVRFFALIGAFTFISSCGGGGGGGGGSASTGGGGGSTPPTQPTNNAPSFTSANTASILEGTTAALTIEVADEDSDDTIAQSITGGADADLFELGVCNASRCTSNTLSFKAAPNFESPQDADGGNDYVVIVEATDASDPVEQTITISVTNAVEGRIVDAPLSGAAICIDQDEDWECDVGPPDDVACAAVFPPGDGCFTESSGTSDTQGYYSLAEGVQFPDLELRVLSIGGTDILTQKELPNLALIAEMPADPTQPIAVTPLSTVVSIATDPQAVMVALGFPETVTPAQITSFDPWALANDSTESSGEFAASADLAAAIGITTAELESVADNVVTTSVQIANVIQAAESVVTDTTTSGIQSVAERAAMISSTVTQELVETIDATVASSGSAAAASVDLSDATVTNEVLKETAEESATLIVAEIEAKQTAGTLDLSDANDTTVAEILQIKETQEVITQTGLNDDQTENIGAVATTAADTNALIEEQVANVGVAVLTTASSAEEIAEIVTNTSTLAEQLVSGEITTDTFTASSDVDTQASASGGLNEAAAQLIDTDGDGIFDVNDAFPNDVTETLDTDGDGIGDNADAFPNDPTETLDSDGNGVGDNADTDSLFNQQVVTSDSVFITMPSNNGDEVTLSVSYQTNPVSIEATGLGVKMFFDSDKLTFASLLVDADEDLLQATTTSAGIQEDSSNLDTDALTDKFANIAYVSFTGEFSVPSTPLYRIIFRATDTFDSGSTQINFTLITAEGFTGQTSNVTLSF